MTRKPAALPLAASVLFACAYGALAGDIRILRDVTYRKTGSTELQLDAYLYQSASPAPVLIYVHGGGSSRGSRSAVPAFLRPALADAGVTFISVGYRLSGEAVWPAPADDVTRAVQFVRSKAKEWNLDSKRIAGMGLSAGAHLTLWVGLHDDRANRNSKDPVDRESSRLCAVVNYYGPTDFSLFRRIPDKHANSAYRTLFGYPEGQSLSVVTQKQITHASPVSYVSSDDPAVFTAHGTADTTVPVEHAESLIASLKNAGVGTTSYLLPGGNHGLTNPVSTWPDHQKAAIAFLRRHLGRP
jgi:acetyl esterase/lipase